MDIEKEWQKVGELAEQIEEVKDKIEEYLTPILKKLGYVLDGSIYNIFFYKDHLYIDTERYTSGGRYTNDFKIPISVLNDKDPLSSAEAYAAGEAERKRNKNNAKTLAEIERLKKSLEQG